MARRYAAIIFRQRKCEACDPVDAGDGNRQDCGCLEEQIVGTYDTLPVARMVAGRSASLGKPGRMLEHDGMRPTGAWKVVDLEREEEMVAHNL